MMKRCLYALLALLFAAGVNASESSNRFERTARALAAAPEESREAFARIALEELAAALLAEAELARVEMADSERPGKLASWSKGVEAYSTQLLKMLENMSYGDLPEVSVDRHGSVAVAVGAQRVLLSHPRGDGQSAYEQEVLGAFCDLRYCEGLTSAPEQASPIEVTSSRLPVAWSFSEDGPVCSARALSLQLPASMALPAARMLCVQMFAELGALYAAIAREQRHGVLVDWNGLRVETLPSREDHLVRLNAQGDSLLLPLPLLARTPELLRRTEPWGRGLLEGEQRALAMDALEFGWD